MTNLLVLAETDGTRILPGTLSSIAFAQRMAREVGGDYDLLLIGGMEIENEADAWRGYGTANILTAASPALAHPTADRVAVVCMLAMQQTGATTLIGLSSSFGRDALPRVAALLALPMVSDVTQIEKTAEGLRFQRPMYAGNILATVQIAGDQGVFSARGTAFKNPETTTTLSEIKQITVDTAALPQGTTWIGLEAGDQKRPELTTASVVVSGGRPLKDAATFEHLVGGLADRLGGAVGATRAAVDSGIAANELQIGQTGKVVAPQLYIAAGISGSVQHFAGMKDSKVIVAINTDPDASIFEIADYGLVADLHTALPELIAKL